MFHNFILLIDTLHMYRIKVSGNKIFTEPQLLSFQKRSVEDSVPAIGLQNGDIIFLFILIS